MVTKLFGLQIHLIPQLQNDPLFELFSTTKMQQMWLERSKNVRSMFFFRILRGRDNN
jgi:hypothetical protein